MSGAKKEWCFMCEFECLILKAKEGKSPLSPIGILSQLRNIGSQLGNGREEDAHEFLRCASFLRIWSLYPSLCFSQTRTFPSSGNTFLIR